MIIGAIFAAVLFVVPPHARAEISADNSTAVIFVYQRVGEDSVAQSNISLEQFKEHITELTKGSYSVLPLPKIINALKNGDTLPPHTIGLTFDGAYQATLANAAPLLEDAKLPFTVFFASDMADGGNPAHMNWNQIKKLKKDPLVSLGILPAAYAHMPSQTSEQNSTLINKAIAKYRDVLGEEPAFFSYPYGEYNTALKKQLAGYNFKGVFGQQSGVIYPHSDFLALPRFTMTDDYGDLDRFVLTANAAPLPVSEVVPEDTVLAQNPPIIGFTVAPGISNLSKLSCFGSGLGKLKLARIGGGRIEMRPEQPFVDRRTRINCTLPNDVIMPGEARSWRWFGMLLIAPSVEEDSGEDSAENPEEPEENQ
ncbi:MAG: polysaccharide deacetylase family protein [Alphaproteobacteria bacterium]|nr:polysaccharide deacetylase family protein [Alphaproteobacteria bacterium]